LCQITLATDLLLDINQVKQTLEEGLGYFIWYGTGNTGTRYGSFRYTFIYSSDSGCGSRAFRPKTLCKAKGIMKECQAQGIEKRHLSSN
jgi:hypothetical protein